MTSDDPLTWCLGGGMGLLSALLAVTLPERFIGAAGWCYGLLAIIMPTFGAVTSRRFRRQFPGARADG